MYTPASKTVCLKKLIEACPNLEPDLQAIRDRLVDLYTMTKDNYCHPDMHGSWSIKAVLPTIAPDLSYDDLEEVKVGTDAEVKFLEMLAPETTKERAQRLRNALLEYCKLDTLAMVRLAWFLEGRADV